LQGRSGAAPVLLDGNYPRRANRKKPTKDKNIGIQTSLSKRNGDQSKNGAKQGQKLFHKMQFSNTKKLTRRFFASYLVRGKFKL
jgi:hypothetical protein